MLKTAAAMGIDSAMALTVKAINVILVDLAKNASQESPVTNTLSAAEMTQLVSAIAGFGGDSGIVPMQPSMFPGEDIHQQFNLYQSTLAQ
jgi:hypothetical protein